MSQLGRDWKRKRKWAWRKHSGNIKIPVCWNLRRKSWWRTRMSSWYCRAICAPRHLGYWVASCMWASGFRTAFPSIDTSGFYWSEPKMIFYLYECKSGSVVFLFLLLPRSCMHNGLELKWVPDGCLRPRPYQGKLTTHCTSHFSLVIGQWSKAHRSVLLCSIWSQLNAVKYSLAQNTSSQSGPKKGTVTSQVVSICFLKAFRQDIHLSLRLNQRVFIHFNAASHRCISHGDVTIKNGFFLNKAHHKSFVQNEANVSWALPRGSELWLDLLQVWRVKSTRMRLVFPTDLTCDDAQAFCHICAPPQKKKSCQCTNVAVILFQS